MKIVREYDDIKEVYDWSKKDGILTFVKSGKEGMLEKITIDGFDFYEDAIKALKLTRLQQPTLGAARGI